MLRRLLLLLLRPPPERARMRDLVELNRRAVQRSVEIVEGVTVDQLGYPTPCAAWRLGDLLAHMIAQHHGFAAAADGNTTDLSVWDMPAVGDDPAGAYRAAAERVMTAFAADHVVDRMFWLPEIRDGGLFPGEMAVSFHLVDYVVHGWDVAASLGLDADYAPDLVTVALLIAERVPTGPARVVAGAPFQPPLPSGPRRSPMERMLLLLGRSPSWPKPALAG
jgi:uncharacterized protein (TIGR03086 family)